MGIKHIHGNTTSLNGCEVEIDGDVVFALIPPRIIAFRGVVHLNGGPDCPNGDLYFGSETKVRTIPVQPANECKP